MTDTELLHEVEQAMLGAMITRPRRVGGLPARVSPDLFTDQRHQAIAAALTGTAGSERGLLGRLRGFFARFSRRTREDQAYLDTLPELCPDAGHMAGYFDILREARDQRDAQAREAMNQAADAARILEGAADKLAVQTTGAARTTAPGELSEQVARQARALSGHAQRLSHSKSLIPVVPGRQRQSAPGPQSQPAARGALAPQAANGRAAPAATSWGASGAGLSAPPGQRTQAQPGAASRSADNGGQAQTRSGESSQAKSGPATREEAQDLLLAALMRDPGFAREAVASLPATLFDDGERRELFTMIGEFVSARRPVDPLLMAWAADQRSASEPDGTRNGWLTSDYVRGIAALPAAPGNPGWLAQMLSNSGTNTAEPDQSKPQAAEVSSPGAPSAKPDRDTAKPATAGKPAPATGPQPNQAPVGLAPSPELLMDMPPESPDQGGTTPRM